MKQAIQFHGEFGFKGFVRHKTTQKVIPFYLEEQNFYLGVKPLSHFMDNDWMLFLDKAEWDKVFDERRNCNGK